MERDMSSWRFAASIRLIIADDHEIVRAGLRGLLESAGEFELVGEAATGREALHLCRSLRPNVALLDVQMPDMNGLEATRAIKQLSPETRVIIVTIHDDPRYLVEAFQAGASGYLLKDVSRAELIAAVRQVVRGLPILNAEMAARALRQISSAMPRRVELPLEQLTPRERDVLRLLIHGKTNREIAGNLSLSAGTVKVYVERIIAKMGVSDRTQAAVRAVELGLFQGGMD